MGWDPQASTTLFTYPVRVGAPSSHRRTTGFGHYFLAPPGLGVPVLSIRWVWIYTTYHQNGLTTAFDCWYVLGDNACDPQGGPKSALANFPDSRLPLERRGLSRQASTTIGSRPMLYLLLPLNPPNSSPNYLLNCSHSFQHGSVGPLLTYT